MSKKSYYLWMAVLIVLTILLLSYALRLLEIIFLPNGITVWRQLELYLWCSVGFVAFFILRRYSGSNLRWLETFSHEFTHIVVAMIFFRKVHSFYAGSGNGEVETSGRKETGLVPMALAPYCLPVFTYLLLFLRPLIGMHGLWFFDLLVGMSLSFHYVCFKTQTGSFQPDIHQYPLSFSYLYIAVAHLMNFCIIWVSFFPGYHVFSSVWRMVTTMWKTIL